MLVDPVVLVVVVTDTKIVKSSHFRHTQADIAPESGPVGWKYHRLPEDSTRLTIKDVEPIQKENLYAC